MTDKAPAFQWYPKDYMSDANVLRMTFEERGIYDWLLSSAWLEEGIPDDMEELARLCSVTKRKMQSVWPRIRPCFDPHPEREGWLVHDKQEKQRRKQKEYRRKKQEAGKAGAEARWGNDEADGKDIAAA